MEQASAVDRSSIAFIGEWLRRAVALRVALALILGAVAPLPFLASEASAACDTSWVSPVSGNWTDATNWTNGVPTSSTGACITQPGSYTVTLIGAQSAASLTVGAGATLQIQGDFSNNTSLLLGSDSSNDGTIVLDSVPPASRNAELTVTGGSTLTNTGTLRTDASWCCGRFLRGNIANSGTVTINQNTNYDQSGSTFTNTGTLTVAANITLTLSNSPTFNQNAGSLTANGTFLQWTGAFKFNGGSVAGPALLQDVALTITTPNTGDFRMRGTNNTLSGNVSASQTLLVQGEACCNAAVTLTGNSSNAGAIVLDSVPPATRNAELTVTGGGTLTNTGTLTTNATWTGGRTISALLDNQGTFTTKAPTTLQAPNAAHTNEGLWEVAVGTLTLPQQGNPATIANTGTLVVDAGARLEALNNGSISNSTTTGLIAGSGTIAAGVTSDATVGPGSADGTTTGILTIQGNYTQTTNGTLLIELCGTTVGTQYDQLALTGNANAGLAGTLMVTNANPTNPCYNPQLNDTFRVMTFGSQTGDFATYSLPPLNPGLSWQANLASTFLDLTVVEGAGAGNVTRAAGSASKPNIVTTSKPPSRPRPAPSHPAPAVPPLRRP